MKKAVTTFGRMNQLHRGHLVLLQHMSDLAHKTSSDCILFLSPAHDNKSNPISYFEKIRFSRALIKENGLDIKVYDYSADVTGIWESLHILQELGYTDVVMIVGSDNMRMKPALIRDNSIGYSKSDPKSFGFDSFDLLQRRGDSRGTESSDPWNSLSATELRQMVRDDDFKSFFKNIPTQNTELAQEIFDATREGLSKA